MRKSLLLLLLVTLLVAPLCAQSDVIYYRFIKGTGTTVQNFYPPTNGLGMVIGK